MITLRRYTPADKTVWDDFVERSKNATFLHHRDYMDYHSDRFNDFSLLAFRDDKLYALLPACSKDGRWISHAGLTYGGILMSEKCTAAEILELFQLLCDFLLTNGFSQLVYSPVPHIYHHIPSEEDLYALFRAGAKLSARKISSVVEQKAHLKWRNIRKAGIKKAEKEGVVISPSYDYSAFWEILSNNLAGKYGAKPVHTVEEISRLHSLFPDNIHLYVAKKNDRLLAGVVIFRMKNVAHCQYISADEEGKRIGALDLLFHHLMNDACKNVEWFDFGTSNEDAGRYLNESLIYQKEGFGGRAICYDTYTLPLDNIRE